jgi:hypothetical protein
LHVFTDSSIFAIVFFDIVFGTSFPSSCRRKAGYFVGKLQMLLEKDLHSYDDQDYDNRNCKGVAKNYKNGEAWNQAWCRPV